VCACFFLFVCVCVCVCVCVPKSGYNCLRKHSGMFACAYVPHLTWTTAHLTFKTTYLGYRKRQMPAIEHLAAARICCCSCCCCCCCCSSCCCCNANAILYVLTVRKIANILTSCEKLRLVAQKSPGSLCATFLVLARASTHTQHTHNTHKTHRHTHMHKIQ